MIQDMASPVRDRSCPQKQDRKLQKHPTPLHCHMSPHEVPPSAFWSELWRTPRQCYWDSSGGCWNSGNSPTVSASGEQHQAGRGSVGRSHGTELSPPRTIGLIGHPNCLTKIDQVHPSTGFLVKTNHRSSSNRVELNASMHPISK